jgi:hypothetical protein
MFDYPAIYKEADNISNKTQKNYLGILLIFLGMLFFSSLLFSYFNSIIVIKIVNIIISFLIVILSFVFHFNNFQGKWYNARAVAESIKTISWRYAVKAEPYNIPDNNARALFIKTIKHIIDMNHDFKKCIEAEYSGSTQHNIPNNLTAVRLLSLQERINFYQINRLLEQKDWYTKKSLLNKKRSLQFFLLLIFISFVLLILLIISLTKTSNNMLFPIESLLSMISILFTWIQTKKYKELEKSYALTAHEIGFIEMPSIDTDEKIFSDYVSNTENAFSREHTQWIAKKDS